MSSMLQDELADAKSLQERTEKRLKGLQAQNKALELKLEQYQKEADEWREFSAVIDQVKATSSKLLNACGTIKKTETI
jgi:hypothetical protein